MVLENTHPALVSREVWDIVQRVRQHKRRPTKMDEQNKYSGWWCAPTAEAPWCSTAPIP